ncbi:LacI family DNA-binding transcriptional regulator [Microbacterium sp.]|uniref:LacI family DNA-binding transcriptional regulator n=1 Tax=Microbacterium sp. TaxID=51671 RepID=UPI002810CE7F|nr:LacI family DNA-binding transcriptional regulator [Microbacterium sp.]
MAQRRATVYDVAERAGVSIATVSFAFRQPDRVRGRTREAVYRAASELGYAPSASARQLAGGMEGALGLYAFDMVLPSDREGTPESLSALLEHELGGGLQLNRFPLYVDEIQHGFQLESMRRGRNVMIGSAASDDHVATMDIAGSIDGLAMFPGTVMPEVMSRVADRVPVVVFSRSVDDDFFEVRVDNVAAIHEMVDHLVDVHAHQRIAFVGGLSAPDIVERFAAFQDAARRRGLPVPAEPFDSTALTGARLAGVRQAIENRDLPDALLCATDQLALTVLDYLSEHGVRVPEDVAVTGFDGIAASLACTPPLTTVRQPFVTMGRLAVRILLGDEDVVGTRKHILPTQLVRRASCGCTEAS